MASSTESATLEAEPITEGTKEESVAEQEDSARNVHGIKVVVPSFIFIGKI